MAKTPKQPSSDSKDDAIMERMNEALKRMMKTPHETQKEMIERRRRQEGLPSSTAKQRKGDIEKRKKFVSGSKPKR